MQLDRFAREIVCILAFSYAARSRRLMRNPLGGAWWKFVLLRVLSTKVLPA
jgi:hypothetical protein